MPTINYNLAYLSNGQINKEGAINQDLDTIDALLAPVVGSVVLQTHIHLTPPTTPLLNRVYLLGSGTSGIFTGYDDGYAIYTTYGWSFYQPTEKMVFYDEAGRLISNVASQWSVSGAVAFSDLIIFPFETFISSGTTLLSSLITGKSYAINGTATIEIDASSTNFAQYEFIVINSGNLTLTASGGRVIQGLSSFVAFNAVRIYLYNNDAYVAKF